MKTTETPGKLDRDIMGLEEATRFRIMVNTFRGTRRARILEALSFQCQKATEAEALEVFETLVDFADGIEADSSYPLVGVIQVVDFLEGRVVISKVV